MAEQDEGSWLQYSKVVLKLLEQHEQQIDILETRLSAAERDRAIILEHISSLKETSSQIYGILRDGTAGSPSVLSKLQSLESQIASLREGDSERKKRDKEITAYKVSILISIGLFALSALWDFVQKVIMAGK